MFGTYSGNGIEHRRETRAYCLPHVYLACTYDITHQRQVSAYHFFLTGIKLYADFDSDIEYTVHFYDDNEVWISCIDNEGLNLTVEDMPEDTYGVRIVIYPQSDENGKISLFERGTYANQLTVKITDKEIKAENTATE